MFTMSLLKMAAIRASNRFIPQFLAAEIGMTVPISSPIRWA